MNLPNWATGLYTGVTRSRDEQFMDVLGAFANYNRRPPVPTMDELRAIRAQEHKNDPRHKKALAKRRKRKRGGPK